jgi:hypothetical protein
VTSGGWLSRIAEADAGLPDADRAAQVLAAGDPGTERVVAALTATRAELALVPPSRLPAALAARLAAGFDAADAAAEPGRSGSPSATERRAGRPSVGRAGSRRRRRTLVLTAAAAALVAVVLTGPPARPPTDLATATGRVLAAGTRDVGELSDPARLDSCLVRSGAPAAAGPLLAGRPIRLGGVDGLLLVISTGTKGRVRAVVPTTDCGRVLADVTVGG